MDRPILFSGPMVRALLAGNKTQTRRIIKDAPSEAGWLCYHKADGERTWVGPNGYPSMPCIVRFAKGDRLWVRETFSGDSRQIGKPRDWDEHGATWYWADGNPAEGDWTKPKPGIHMPRWASRLTLTVTDVRVQRLQEISAGDCAAEGACGTDADLNNAQRAYRDVWEKINGLNSWLLNPWIVAVTFDVHKCNIDRLEDHQHTIRAQSDPSWAEKLRSGEQ